MNESQITINELASRMITDMQRIGYSEMTIWRYHVPRIGKLRNYYRETGNTVYDPTITLEYVQLQKKRMEAGEITAETYRKCQNAARWMNSYFLTGKLFVNTPKRGTVYMVSSENEALIDRFVENGKYGQNTVDDVVWIVRRYLHHWESLGHRSMETVSIDDVREYILKTSTEMKVASLSNVLLYLKQFHIFLKDSGIAAPDCVELLAYKVYRDMPIQSYITDEELDRILHVIDTTTEVGKRNKAIILLGATTGLRAVDIIRMKLTDIDWRKGEITVVQAKTGRTIHTPILKETGEALQDYILNARPLTSDCQEVFLRAIAPKTAIKDAMCITCMFRSYQDAAGIRRQAFDGKGFHGLRRRLAKKMLVSGISVTTIAQVLGHNDPDSARQYLSLNSENLKECALDFRGITVNRRELL